MQTAKPEPNLEISGIFTNTPPEDVGKLSYYLDCVNACAPGIVDEALTNFDNIKSFTTDQKFAILKISKILKPDVLENYVLLKTTKNNMEAIKPHFSNSFTLPTKQVTLSSTTIDKEDLLGLKIGKINVSLQMLYTEEWLNDYYFTPLLNIEQELDWQAGIRPKYSKYYFSSEDDDDEYVDESAVFHKKSILSFLAIAFFGPWGMAVLLILLNYKILLHWRFVLFYIVMPASIVYGLFNSLAFLLLQYVIMKLSGA